MAALIPAIIDWIMSRRKGRGGGSAAPKPQPSLEEQMRMDMMKGFMKELVNMSDARKGGGGGNPMAGVQTNPLPNRITPINPGPFASGSGGSSQ